MARTFERDFSVLPYLNSEGNLSNPDPGKAVGFGRLLPGTKEKHRRPKPPVFCNLS